MGRLTLRIGSALVVVLSLFLAACGGGNGSGNGGGDNGMAIASSELNDPSPAAGDFFGEALALLANGNIVVNDPLDDSAAENGGAVHLFDPIGQTLIASAFGDATNDAFGLVDEFDGRGVVALTNGNYVIASPLDDEGGVEDAGTVRLMNGTSGAQIGTTAMTTSRHWRTATTSSPPDPTTRPA